MKSEEYAEFLEQIRRHFVYLFDPYGFEMVHCERPEPGRHLIILESDDCRIRFIQNLWDLEMAIGPRSAPIRWSDSVEEARYWYSVTEVSNFLENNHYVDIEELLQDRPFLTADQKLAKLSGEVKPLIDRIQVLFRESVFEQKRYELDRFLLQRRQEVRRQLEELERKKWEKRKCSKAGDQSSSED